MKMFDGKTLEEIAYDVDIRRKAIKTVLDDQACICWQENGTLSYFDYHDGYPSMYYSPNHDFACNLENFTSLPCFAQFLKTAMEVGDDYFSYLLTAPVWCVIEVHSESERDAFNMLLAGIEINL